MVNLERELFEKAARAVRELRGLRRPRVEDVFERKCYLVPSLFSVENYPRKRPHAAFNPGALVKGKRLLLFPRLVFDYYKYVSSIGVTELEIDELLEGRVEEPLRTKLVLWPRELWEFLGCEDPRISATGDDVLVLYTGKGYSLEGELVRRDVLALARVDGSWEAKSKSYFRIKRRGEEFVPPSNKDSAFVRIAGEEATMLTRPEVRGIRICWRAEADLARSEMRGDALEPVFSIEEWEIKVGWSTNVLKLSSNEYLVGWHGVLKTDLSYREGLAIVDDQGRLLAVSDYLLSPRGVCEEYGDRPLVIFGDGLVAYREYLLWIGGISDYAIGVFAARLDRALGKLRWLEG